MVVVGNTGAESGSEGHTPYRISNRRSVVVVVGNTGYSQAAKGSRACTPQGQRQERRGGGAPVMRNRPP